MPAAPPVQQPDSGAARGITLPTTSGFVTGSGEGEYLGMTVQATTGCTVVLYDNATTNSGIVLDAIVIPSTGGAQSTNYPRPARQVVNGIYASISGGTPTGTVFQ